MNAVNTAIILNNTLNNSEISSSSLESSSDDSIGRLHPEYLSLKDGTVEGEVIQSYFDLNDELEDLNDEGDLSLLNDSISVGDQREVCSSLMNINKSLDEVVNTLRESNLSDSNVKEIERLREKSKQIESLYSNDETAEFQADRCQLNVGDMNASAQLKGLFGFGDAQDNLIDDFVDDAMELVEEAQEIMTEIVDIDESREKMYARKLFTSDDELRDLLFGYRRGIKISFHDVCRVSITVEKSDRLFGVDDKMRVWFYDYELEDAVTGSSLYTRNGSEVEDQNKIISLIRRHVASKHCLE